MNRATRRKKEREIKKNKNLETKETANIKSFISNLTPKQVQVINDYINSEINAGVKEEVEYRTKCLDTTFTAAMILKTDFDYEEISSIFSYSFELLEELESKDKALREQYKERYAKYMIKQEEEIKAYCEELLTQGIKQKEAIEALTYKFPKIAKANLSNAYRNVKKQYAISEKEAERQLKKVLEIEDIETIKEDEKPVIEANNKEIKEDKKMAAIKPTLKIKKLEIEGEHGGEYTVIDGAVTVGGFTFSSKEDFNAFVKEATEVFNLAEKH